MYKLDNNSKLSSFDVFNVLGFVFYFTSINTDDLEKNTIFMILAFICFLIAFVFIVSILSYLYKQKLFNKKKISLFLRFGSVLFCVVSLTFILFF